MNKECSYFGGKVKFGIDINNDKIFSFVSESLNGNGNFIVDLRENKDISYGKLLLKKVLIANITNVDTYFAINFKNNIADVEIFYNGYSSSKIKAEKIKEMLKKKFDKVICDKDDNLYLVKNINSEVIYLRIPIASVSEFGDTVLEEIIKVLIEDE